MAPSFDEVSHRITSIVGLPLSPGRWRLVNGRINADCSAVSVIVLMGAPGEHWTATDVRSAADLDQLAEKIVNFVASNCLSEPSNEAGGPAPFGG